jgi:4-diphosphocytidyl-2-C-methyl-D-erythritol kinase
VNLASVSLESPAKINVGLRILGRRMDGFHELQGIFVPISFGDQVQIKESEAPGFHFTLHTQNCLTGEAARRFDESTERGDIKQNTVYRALHALAPFIQDANLHLEITLVKRVPAGAGLGGGSSNAGVVLKHLKQRLSLRDERAHAAAVRAGADVPFFLLDGSAFVEGVGDRLRPIDFPHGQGVLCLSDFYISTPEAYRDLKRPLQGDAVQESRTSFERWQEAAFSLWKDDGFLHNDFEEVAFQKHPDLARVKQALKDRGAFASLTGSGSAIYGLLPEGAADLAKEMAERFPGCRFESFQF